MPCRVALSICLALIGIVAGPAHAAPQGAPAIGYDWMAPPDAAAPAGDPEPWPRADATDTGLDDMIRAERRPLDVAMGATPRLEGGDQRILRKLRKVGGDYVVVPVLTLRLDRAVHH